MVGMTVGTPQIVRMRRMLKVRKFAFALNGIAPQLCCTLMLSGRGVVCRRPLRRWRGIRTK
jgi:hypothetical protein